MLISPAHTHRYRRFADALTGAHARLAEKRGWLVLCFSGLSPPILCQLAWRTVPFSFPDEVTVPFSDDRGSDRGSRMGSSNSCLAVAPGLDRLLPNPCANLLPLFS